MDSVRKPIIKLALDIRLFSIDLSSFLSSVLRVVFNFFESHKNKFVKKLYRERGRLAGRFVHSGMAGISALGVMIAPILVGEIRSQDIDPWREATEQVLSASVEEQGMDTDFVDGRIRDNAVKYTVQPGDTVSAIAKKFDVSEDTIRWQNNLVSKNSIKEGQALEILPVSGVSHKVTKGETVYSIAEKYDAEPQAIVNYPFNTFLNDETFELAIGQTIIVPDGVKKETVLWQPLASNRRQVTPDAGTVVASGSFVWPTQGTITQRFSWYHKGIDVANRAAPNIVAADAGKVVTAGWSPVGYGNHVIIDHGNGYKTLYAHMQKLYVTVGQTVGRGGAIGQMGSTGRSTGTHLHLEIIKNGTKVNPLTLLK
jgi:murein DD-endopeptidase MepM/ murein hydrolase activator NlpD